MMNDRNLSIKKVRDAWYSTLCVIFSAARYPVLEGLLPLTTSRWYGCATGLLSWLWPFIFFCLGPLLGWNLNSFSWFWRLIVNPPQSLPVAICFLCVHPSSRISPALPKSCLGLCFISMIFRNPAQGICSSEQTLAHRFAYLSSQCSL